MMNYIKKIVFFVSLIFLYLIFKELVLLYNYSYNISPYLAYMVFAAVLFIVIYFAVIPVVKIFKYAPIYKPQTDRDNLKFVINSRFKNFEKNPYLIEKGFNLYSIERTEEGYKQVCDFIKPEAEKLRKKYVANVFYTTATSQNGFLDAIFILSLSVNMVRDMFRLYHGRVPNRELWSIARKVYYSVLISGTEGIEYITEEVMSKLTFDGINTIPFVDKIFSSMADGFVNAAMLTRISIITENYCTKLYIQSDRELYPSPNFIGTTTKFIVSDIIEKVKKVLIKFAKEQGPDYIKAKFQLAANPVRYIFEKADDIKTGIADSDIWSNTKTKFGSFLGFMKNNKGSH